MKKQQLLLIWIALIVLTILVALVSNMLRDLQYATIVILGISMLKFIGVSFYFMELKKAHVFWKVSILTYLFLFSTITLIFLN